MKHRVENTSSEEEEEEEPVRRSGGFRMITNTGNQQYQTGMVESSDAANQSPQQQQLDATRARQREAQQHVREEALRLQAEARARAETARAEQVRLYQEQLRQQQQKQQQQAPQNQRREDVQHKTQQQQPQAQQLKTQQEAIKLAEQATITQQLKQQQTLDQAHEQKIQKSQRVSQQPIQNQRVQYQQQEQQQSNQLVQQTSSKSIQLQPTQQKQAQQKATQPFSAKEVAQQTKTKQFYDQKQPQQQQTLQKQQKQLPQTPQKPVVKNQKEQQKKQHLVEKGGAENPFGTHSKPILAHTSSSERIMNIQNDGSKSEAQSRSHNQILEDAAWLLQKRIPQEDIQAVIPERIKLPDFLESREVKPTVIVPKPAKSTRVQWDEFPVEEEKEKMEIPRVRAVDWEPQNDVEHVVQRTLYRPGRISRQWPPPGYDASDHPEIGKVASTKTLSDDEWIQANEKSEGNDTKDVIDTGNAPWRQHAHTGALKSRVWPPIIQEITNELVESGPKLEIQWPPVENEEKELQDVKSLQTHLPVKPHQRQWPPPGYENVEHPFIEV